MEWDLIWMGRKPLFECHNLVMQMLSSNFCTDCLWKEILNIFKNWVKKYIIMFSIKCFIVISCDLQIDKDFSMYLSKPFVNAKGYFKNMTIGYFWDNLMWMVHNNIIIKIDRSNHFSFLRTHIMRNIEAKWCFMHGCWNKITFFDKDILEMNSWWSIMINCSHHSYRFINGGYLFFSDM